MFWSKIAYFALRNRIPLLFAILSVTVWMGYNASKVQITWEFARLLPDDDSTFVDYQNFKNRFGEDGAIMVLGIQDSSIFKKDYFNAWHDLTTDIKKIDGIKEVVSVARIYNLTLNDSTEKFDFSPITPYQGNSQNQIERIRRLMLTLRFYDGFIINKSTEATLMAITFDKDKLNSKTRIAMVDSIIAKSQVFEKNQNTKIHYSGLPFIRSKIAMRIWNEMQMFLLLAFLVTGVILIIFFRSFYPVFFSLLVVVIGVIWSFGTIVLLGYKITVLSGLIPPLITVIGIPNCILMINKYHVEFQRHGNKARSLTRMIEKIGISTFFANVTTAIGFGVFCITNSQILVEFGLVASLNVMGTYLTSMLFIPIVFSFLPSPNVKNIKHLDAKVLTGVLNKIDYWVHHYRNRIYVSTFLVIVVSIFGISKIRAIGYVVDDLPKKDPVLEDMAFFQRNFKGVLPFEIEIDTRKKGGAMALNTLYKINRLQKMIVKYEEFSKPISSVEAIKFSYQAYKGGSPSQYILPSGVELSRLGNLFSQSGAKKDQFKSFLDSTKQITRVSVQMADVGSIRMKELVKELKPRIDSIFPPDQYNVKMTGSSVMFLKGNDYLVRNLQESVLLAVILISLVMITLFMSFRMVWISILPSLIPLLMTAGLMGFFHIPLKPSTILVFSIAFGIASDGNMYFLTKYRQEYKNNHYSISKTVSVTLRETGISMIYTAIILFAGFSIFTASSFGGTAALGILISVTLLMAYISNLILLPSFLLSLEKRILTKAFLEDSLVEMHDEEEDIELNQLKIKGQDYNNLKK